MSMQQLIKKLHSVIVLVLLIGIVCTTAQAKAIKSEERITIDRIQLVTQQINLLKSRLDQSDNEFADLQHQHDQQISGLTIEKTSKSLLDKVSLDISVAKSNVDSLNIELTDTQQTITWLEKSVQEIESQLNVLSIFGLKIAKNEILDPKELRTDLTYQQTLLKLEQSRLKYLQKLQHVADNILSLRNDNYNQLTTLLKSRNLLHIKQVQVNDELAYQEQQNFWLQQLNKSYARLAKIDPIKDKAAYAAVERDIYRANEEANYAYVQSLIARYDDQIQQMKLAVMRSSSISVLNEISDQYQILNKQIDKLTSVLKSRIDVLEHHVSYLAVRKKNVTQFQSYLSNLAAIAREYKSAEVDLTRIKKNLSTFRQTLDHALQVELSSRQGFPTFGFKTFLDIGKEILLVPTLTFQIVKSLSNLLVKGVESTSILGWSLFVFAESALLGIFYFMHFMVVRLLARPSKWRDKINSKWLSLQWLGRNLIDLFIISNIISVMVFFGIAQQYYLFIIYLSFVWLAFKGIILITRLCLVETTHDTAGHDMKLYHRLKWIILIGGIITALTVFVHQLPLIYELKTLCDRLFLILLMVVSLLLLRSYEVVPNLILSHTESNHPYLHRSIRLIGILVPILIFGNSIIGVFGYLNLIMTVSWYEGLFLIVLIGYLLLRGILSDAMEQLSHLMIQYVHNGWLWTEAFLKPLDKVLRITLFLMAWTVLFILYGWDKQSPIVERLTRLLHYKIASVLGSSITPMSMIELFIVISVFFWTAKWIREFVYRLLLSRTKDMGLRNSIAILSQYAVIVLGVFICMRVIGINSQALAAVVAAFAFAVGLGLRDLANNFACGFLILLERPLRVGDIVNINQIEGEVTHIGSRAVTVRTWDFMELVVPNAEIFNKAFTNWTAKDNIVRSVVHIKISRYDNPHEVKALIQKVLTEHKDVLKDPIPEVFLKDMSDTLMDFEIRYFVNIRQIKSRTSVISNVLMQIWDVFVLHGIKPPYPQQEIVIRNEMPTMDRFPKIVDSGN